MTKAEKLALANALENCINREKRLCERYLELNPAEKERRERDRDLVILGIQLMFCEAERQLGREE
mgnify:CR=1 FL=1